MATFYGSVYFLARVVSPRDRVRPANVVVCAVLLAVSMLTRPIALFLPAVYSATILLFSRLPIGRRLVLSAILVGVVGTVLAPWELVLYRQTGQLVPLSSAGVPALRDGLSFNHKDFRQPLSLPADVAALSDEFWQNYEEYQSPSDIGAFIWQKFRTAPGAVAKLYGIKAARELFGTDSQSKKLEFINLILLACYMLPAALGVYLFVKNSPEHRYLVAVLLGLVAYFWAMTTVALSIVRYMIPAIGLLVLFVPFLGEWYLRHRGWPFHKRLLMNRRM